MQLQICVIFLVSGVAPPPYLALLIKPFSYIIFSHFFNMVSLYAHSWFMADPIPCLFCMMTLMELPHCQVRIHKDRPSHMQY